MVLWSLPTNENFFTHNLIWAAGVKGAPVAGLDDSIARGNRIEVDDFNKVKGHENIYALGDVALVQSEKNPDGNPMLASVAAQQGIQLGKNLNNTAKGKDLKPFSYKDKGTMATIGKNLAVVDLPYIKFSGILAWLTWMFVHLMLLVDFRSKSIVFINWAWSYLNSDKGTRLIVRKSKK